MSLDLLRPLLDALDALDAPVSVFIRDDDAGWDDARLLALLDVTTRAGVPIDLAAIPQAVSDALASVLNARIDAMPGLIGVHQHGFAHTNHEPEGRACEFGTARIASEQSLDLLRGRVLLRRRFGARLQRLFTPPWNRCAPCTPGLLAALGYEGLSRTRSAPPQHALPELAVDVDWTREHREGGAPAIVERLRQAVVERAADGAPLGLMLHHAVMDGEQLRWLDAWLPALARHPRLRWRAMGELMPKPAKRALEEARP